jgi:hypothetical protein
MTQFARAAQIRNVLLCTLATLSLAACGGEADPSSAAATGSDTASLVQPNMGMIDRSQGIGDSGSNSSGATAGSTTAPITAAAPPTAGSGTSGSGTTAVGTGSKATPPIKPVTTNGVATLDWMPPTQNSDGSVLTNLAGYTVYYGTSPNDLSQSVKVTNPGLTAYTVTGLNSGTWYFAVTSYSADGVESGRTSTVSTTI